MSPLTLSCIAPDFGTLMDIAGISSTVRSR